MKRLLVILLTAVFCTTFVVIAYADMTGSTTGSYGSGDKLCKCDYTGLIKRLSMKPDLFSVETSAGLIEFKYEHDSQNDCIPLNDCTPFKELKVGDNVRVICKEKKNPMEKKNRLEAICVKKL